MGMGDRPALRPRSPKGRRASNSPLASVASRAIPWSVLPTGHSPSLFRSCPAGPPPRRCDVLLAADAADDCLTQRTLLGNSLKPRKERAGIRPIESESAHSTRRAQNKKQPAEKKKKKKKKKSTCVDTTA